MFLLNLKRPNLSLTLVRELQQWTSETRLAEHTPFFDTLAASSALLLDKSRRELSTEKQKVTQSLLLNEWTIGFPWTDKGHVWSTEAHLSRHPPDPINS